MELKDILELTKRPVSETKAVVKDKSKDKEEKKCLYYEELPCPAPNFNGKIEVKLCASCDRMESHCLPIMVKNVYNNIKRIAVEIFKKQFEEVAFKNFFESKS